MPADTARSCGVAGTRTRSPEGRHCPDCLQSRCREALVDVQCCGGVHSRGGWGGIDVRWLNVFRRKGGIAVRRRRACGRESTALTQPGAVGSQGEGGRMATSAVSTTLPRFSPVGSRIPIEFATRSAMPVKVRHSSRRGLCWNDRQNHHNPPPAELPAGLSCLAHPAAQNAATTGREWGTVFPGLPPDGVDGPVALERARLPEPACGYREPQRAAAFATWVSSGLSWSPAARCSLFGWVGSAGILNRSFPARHRV